MKDLKRITRRLLTVNIFIFIHAFLLVQQGNAQTNSSRLLLALSKTDHTLAIIDPKTLKIIRKVPVGEDPHEIVASPDGKTAYVAIYGGGSLFKLNVIDLIAMKALPDIDTRPLFGPHDVAFSGGKVWFTAEGSKSIGRYDPATGKVDWSMGTGQNRTHMIYLTPDSKEIYTTNVSSGTVSILKDSIVPPGRFASPNAKPRTDWMQTVITVGKGSEGFDVSPDRKKLWTASSEDGMIYVIDLHSKKLEGKIDAKAFGANRLKFTPDGNLVFITSLSSGELFIYDTKTQKEVKRIKLGRGAAGILMDAQESRAFIACSADNNIAVLDLKTLSVTSHLDVGGNPDGMAWAIK